MKFKISFAQIINVKSNSLFVSLPALLVWAKWKSGYAVSHSERQGSSTGATNSQIMRKRELIAVAPWQGKSLSLSLCIFLTKMKASHKNP